MKLSRKRTLLAAPGGDVCCLHEFGMCLFPDVPMTLSTREDTYATVEHIVPRERGGTNEASNLRLSHKKCNHARGTQRLPIEPPPKVREPYVPKNPASLMPFTLEWLRWKGYVSD